MKSDKDGAVHRSARRWFLRLVIGTIAASYLLVVVGGIVRVSGSGMGCGTHWPDCNGAVVPTFSQATAIEYTHRILAATVVLLAIALVAAGVAAFRSDHRVVILTVFALALVLVQAVLGALTVVFDLPPSVVMAHLGTAELFLATLIVLAVVTVSSRHTAAGSAEARVDAPRIRVLAPVAASAVFVLMLVGAYTATSGAGYACTEWPMCNGHYLPTGWTVIDIQLLHRLLALVATFAVALLVVEIMRHRGGAGAAGALVAAVAILLPIQILLGAANIWLKLSPAVSALHLATATAIWGLLVALTAVGVSRNQEGVGDPQRSRHLPQLREEPGTTGTAASG